MPLQNRVTPFGDIVAIPQRGIFIGNRGIIHNPDTRTLLKRRWASRAWLICTCDYKGIRRQVMARRTWTELFFLDEATALAAGHRPCFLCRRQAANSFRAAWAQAKGEPRPNATLIDDVLHAERLDGQLKRLHAIDAPIRDLPDGAVIVAGAVAYTISSGEAYPWTKVGYGAPQSLASADALLTPPSILAALRHGYSPVLHPSLKR